jgi:hypothetical protein
VETSEDCTTDPLKYKPKSSLKDENVTLVLNLATITHVGYSFQYINKLCLLEVFIWRGWNLFINCIPGLQTLKDLVDQV